MRTDIISSVNKEFIKNQLKKGKRLDERGLDAYRKIGILVNPIGTAEGSAYVTLGNTKVLVGVKLGVDKPFSDTPDKGILITNVEQRPIASPTFELGPPNAKSIELARVVDRGLRESEMIDLEKLCMVPGEKVWIVFVDIHVLDYDGNLFDASSFGAVAALINARIPSYEGAEPYDLPTSGVPVSCTAVKIDGNVVLDPCSEEEKIADAKLTVVMDENLAMRAMQKGLSGKFTIEEIRKTIDMMSGKSRELREIIVGGEKYEQKN